MADDTVFDTLVAFLRREGWSFGIGDRSTIKSRIKGSHGIYTLYITYDPAAAYIAVYLELPDSMPGDAVVQGMRLAALINWHITSLTCELHPDTGTVRIRTAMEVVDGVFDERRFSGMLASSVSFVEQHAPLFRKVGKQSLAPDLALEKILADTPGAHS